MERHKHQQGAVAAATAAAQSMIVQWLRCLAKIASILQKNVPQSVHTSKPTNEHVYVVKKWI